MAASYLKLTGKYTFCCVAKFNPEGNINGSYVQNVKPYNASAYIIPNLTTTSTTTKTKITTTATTTTTLAVQTLPIGCLDAFRKSILDRANFLRGSHNAQPLTESVTLNTVALRVSQRLMAGQSVPISTEIIGELRYSNSFDPGMSLSTASDCTRKIELFYENKRVIY